MRIVASVNIDRPASQVWAYVADYGNDPSWRGGVTQMRPSQPGPAKEGVTTHDRQKYLEGSRLVEPTSPSSRRFSEVVEGRLLGLSRPLEPLVAWLLRRQATADLGRLKHRLETSTVRGSAPEEPTP